MRKTGHWNCLLILGLFIFAPLVLICFPVLAAERTGGDLLNRTAEYLVPVPDTGIVDLPSSHPKGNDFCPIHPLSAKTSAFLFAVTTPLGQSSSDSLPAASKNTTPSDTSDAVKSPDSIKHSDGIKSSDVAKTSDGIKSSDSPDSVPTSSGQENTDDKSEFIAEGQGNVPMKWIPSQRVLLGAPPTTITLKDAINRFRDQGAFGTAKDFKPDQLKISIISEPKGKLVTPRLDSDRIILEWTSFQEGKGEMLLGLKYPDCAPVYLSFYVEAWRPHYVWMIITVIGGLGFFLFGMRNMSEGLQLVAGAGLQKLIAVFTENRFLAVGIGILATMVVQSSSVTTVMVVGFINSQIMTLAQGIGVIIGANIGTTVTGWILALKIGEYGLPILGVSTFFYLFAKNNRVRYIAMSVMGLGFLFFGLKTMESGFSQMVELPQFALWIKSVAATSYMGVLKCITIGCILTMIVQSSAATLGITISLASIGAIEFSTAAALVLGENIGTTITALLASIGTATNAKRAAYFHSMFNCIGVTWASILFLPVLLPLVGKLAQVEHGQNVAMGIAMMHSMFNVTNALIFIPFTRMFASILTRFVPEGRIFPQSSLSLTSLGVRHMETPFIAIERSRVEVVRMANSVWEICEWMKKTSENKYADEDTINEIFKQEVTLDDVQDEIIAFLAEILAQSHSEEIATAAREQLRLADELETMSDYFVSILKSNLKLKQSNLSLGERETDEFHALFTDLMNQYLLVRKTYVDHGNINEALQEIYARRNGFTSRVKDIRDRFMQSISDKQINPLVIIAFNSQLTSYRRLREHIQNIAEALSR